MTKRHLLPALAAALLATTAVAQTPLVPLPLHVGGRTQLNASDGQWLHAWPGTYFEAAFKGTSATVRLNDGINKLDIYIDGKLVDSESKPGAGDIELGPLPDGTHTIRVEKRTEAQWTFAGFGGILVPDASDVLPAPQARARQIEFIGDSYTVGYGNTSPKRTCTQDEIWATTDTQEAFGPLTAKHYNADFQVNALSGHGIVRNYNGSPGDPVPVAYPFTLIDHATPYNDAAWQPQIIVIGLGTNDFSTPLNAGEPWATREALHADYEATYVKFVQTLRARNPHAFFILMATDQVSLEIQTEVKKVIATLNAAGESRIDFLPMNDLSFGGCDWHPTTDDDKTVEKLLEAYIDAHPALWQGK